MKPRTVTLPKGPFAELIAVVVANDEKRMEDEFITSCFAGRTRVNAS